MLDLQTFTARASYKYAPSTIRRQLVNLQKFEKWLDERNLTLSSESVIEYLQEQMDKKLDGGSIRNIFFDIQSYVKLMGINLNLEKAREILPRFTLKEAKWMSEEEVRKLFDAALSTSPEIAVFIALAYEYGRRPGEVLSLRWEDIDFERKIIRFPILKRREREIAEFELKDYLIPLLSSLPREGERVFNITHRKLCKRFKRLSLFVLKKPFTPHSLRHSRITHLRKHGIPLDVVSKYIARHASIATTAKIYRHITEEEKSEIPESALARGERE